MSITATAVSLSQTDIEYRNAHIGARIDRLPGTASIWKLVALLSLAGFFELYDLFQIAYLSPGLIAEGIFAKGKDGLLGMPDQAAFASATFLGLFIGASLLTPLADRFGRRAVFTYALIGYTVATLIMGMQHSAAGVIGWRLVVGLGLGVELVTIDTYLSELMPKQLRSSAFAFAFFLQFLSVPVLALMAWWLVPQAPWGVAGWRWVVFASGTFALLIWWLRRRLPESPRWLARHGRFDEAEAILGQLETRCERELGAPLPQPETGTIARVGSTRLADLWKPPYRRRCAMLIVFNVFQAIGFFGFGNWLPALLSSQGASTTHSLAYAFVIALAYPIAPLLLTKWAGHAENKWQIVIASLATVVFGLVFAHLNGAAALMACGALITFSNAWMTFAFHAYQAELFPTALRARAVGFCYAFSRLSTAISSPVIGLLLAHFGGGAVLAFIAASMLVVAAVIGFFGPATHMRALEDISA